MWSKAWSREIGSVYELQLLPKHKKVSLVCLDRQNKPKKMFEKLIIRTKKLLKTVFVMVSHKEKRKLVVYKQEAKETTEEDKEGPIYLCVHCAC